MAGPRCTAAELQNSSVTSACGVLCAYLSEWVACVRSNFLVLCYLHDVKNTLQLHDLATGALLKTFPLEVGSIVGYSGQKKDTEIFYQFTSFLSPGESFTSVLLIKITLTFGCLGGHGNIRV